MKDGNWYGMNQRDNRVWLMRMMKHFSLTRPMVAKFVGVNISTVDRWLVPDASKSHRKMPVMARKLLTYMINAGDIEIKG